MKICNKESYYLVQILANVLVRVNTFVKNDTRGGLNTLLSFKSERDLCSSASVYVVP